MSGREQTKQESEFTESVAGNLSSEIADSTGTESKNAEPNFEPKGKLKCPCSDKSRKNV